MLIFRCIHRVNNNWDAPPLWLDASVGEYKCVCSLTSSALLLAKWILNYGVIPFLSSFTFILGLLKVFIFSMLLLLVFVCVAHQLYAVCQSTSRIVNGEWGRSCKTTAFLPPPPATHSSVCTEHTSTETHTHTHRPFVNDNPKWCYMVIKAVISISKSGKGILPLAASHPSISEYHALYYSSFFFFLSLFSGWQSWIQVPIWRTNCYADSNSFLLALFYSILTAHTLTEPSGLIDSIAS